MSFAFCGLDANALNSLNSADVSVSQFKKVRLVLLPFNGFVLVCALAQQLMLFHLYCVFLVKWCICTFIAGVCVF